MNWITFAIWILISYSAYYAAIILGDYLRAGRSNADDDLHELTFVEDFEPVKLETEADQHPQNESTIFSSGGVSLKELFNLAREESVEFVKSVSF